jgi:hypothetical protein
VLLDARVLKTDRFASMVRVRQYPSLTAAAILMLSSADLAGDAARCWELDHSDRKERKGGQRQL